MATVCRCPDRFKQLYNRIVDRFARSESCRRAKCYLLGLLDRVACKNGWQLAKATGETNQQGTQRLLNSTDWETDIVRDDLQEYMVEHLEAEQSGLLVVDEASFLKREKRA